MMNTVAPLRFQLEAVTDTSAPRQFYPNRLVIAGWAGRDEVALRHHIEELATLGVAPPSQTPLFYAASPDLLTQAPVMQALGADSSGEAEPFLVMMEDELVVGLGSDHTDRKAEAWSVPHSKQLCAKPVASILWHYSEVLPHWDALILRAWIPGEGSSWDLYQEGTVASLRRPDELVRMVGGLAPGAAMLCGTLGAIGGVRPATGFRMQLHDPVLDRTIAHEYQVTALPIIT